MTAVTAPLTETSHDPRTGDPVLTVAIAGPLEVDEAVRAARVAAGSVATTSPSDRAGWLEAIADAVVARADELAEVADRETGLGRVRLDGEVLRCAAQLRFYAAVARDGGFLDVVIDRATQAQPDVRRMRVPLVRSATTPPPRSPPAAPSSSRPTQHTWPPTSCSSRSRRARSPRRAPPRGPFRRSPVSRQEPSSSCTPRCVRSPSPAHSRLASRSQGSRRPGWSPSRSSLR